MLAHTVSLCVGMLRGLLERAKLSFAIVDLTSVNGTAFRQVRVACETHTGVFSRVVFSIHREYARHISIFMYTHRIFIYKRFFRDEDDSDTRLPLLLGYQLVWSLPFALGASFLHQRCVLPPLRARDTYHYSHATESAASREHPSRVIQN